MTAQTRAYFTGTAFADGQAAGSIVPSRVRDLVETSLGVEAVLTDGATVTWDLNVNPVARVTIAGARTISITNGEAGRSYRLAIIQGSGAPWTPTISGATALGTVTWATTVGGVSLVGIDFVNATRYYAVVSTA